MVIILVIMSIGMARPTSSGLPYLVRRAECGRFYYCRSFPSEIVPHIAGVVSIPFARRTFALSAKRMVKISLKTGDEETARDRWAQVHAEVRRVVEEAIQSHAMSQRSAARPLEHRVKLSPAERQAIADQVRHDILAQDDRAEVDPAEASPLARIVAGILHDSGEVSPEDALERGRRIARRGEREEFKALHPKGSPSISDRRIEVFRLMPDATQPGSLVRKLDQVIEPEIDRRLAENGLTLDAGTEHRLAELALQRARVHAWRDIDLREKGEPIQTPVRPEPIIPMPKVDVAEDVAPTLSAMLSIWAKRINPKPKERGDRALYVNRFISLFGDLPVNRITKKHVRDFRDLHREVPKAVPHVLRGASLPELVEWGKAHPQVEKLGWRTINTKAIGSLSALIAVAIRDGFCENNPASGMLLPVARDPGQKEVLPFREAELNSFFRAPEFTSGKPLPTGGAGEAGYWLPLLSLFTGARIEELAQLRPQDIKSDKGIWYFDITTLEDAPDREKDPVGHAKSLKNANARREVPLHTRLIELGFLAYVDDMRARKKPQLFPLLKAYRGRLAKNVGRWLNRLIDERISDRKEINFHSFRHTFSWFLRSQAPIAGVFDKVIDGMMGHAGGHISDHYGLPHVLSARQHALETLKFDGIDFSLLKRPGPL